jgi:hypothetical protein
MKSNTRTLIAAATTVVLATFGGAALAQTTVLPGEAGFVFVDAPSVKTRAEVTADLRAAKANGDYARLNSTRPTFAFEAPVKSRDEVRADVREADLRGELMHGSAEAHFQRG